jgi:purine catabolism regulator
VSLTVADVLALEPVRRGAPRVLAGADRLDAPVRWVHVIELADAAPLLRGGELVLSTGIALPPDPAGLARFVAGLSSVGASALAVELGSRYVRELPRALVDAAVAQRLPLIVLERETQFIAVTEAVHARILASQVAQVRAAERLHQVCTELAVAGASPDEVVAQVSVLAAAPVILEDLAHRVLACAPAGQDAASLLDGFARRSRTVQVTGRSSYDPDARWLVAMVGADPDWGRLIFVLSGPPSPALLTLADRAASTLELARLVAEGRESPGRKARPTGTGGLAAERSAHRSLLAALAGPGYADHAELRARITALGVPLAGRQLLPIVLLAGDEARGGRNAGELTSSRAGASRAASGDSDPDELADAVVSACRVAGVPALAGPLDDRRVAALLALPPGADPDGVLSGLANKLGSAGPIGAGPVTSTLAQARAAFDLASQAAEAGALYGSGRRVVRLPELRLHGLIYQLRDDPRVLAFAERELGPLMRHDESAGTDLTQVLAAYLEAGGNKSQAAHLAGLARPTMYDRISQIEQVLGVSLDQPGSRLALYTAWLALRAAR